MRSQPSHPASPFPSAASSTSSSADSARNVRRAALSPLTTVMNLLARRSEADYEAQVLQHARAVFAVRQKLDALRASFPQFRTLSAGPYVYEQLYILEAHGLYGEDDLVNPAATAVSA